MAVKLTKKEQKLFEKFALYLSQNQHNISYMPQMFSPYSQVPVTSINPYKPEKVKKKTKRNPGTNYLTKLYPANPYVRSLMEVVLNIDPDINLKHTKYDSSGNIFTTYTDVTLLLRKYIEYNNLLNKSFVELDSFLWDLLGSEFTENMIHDKKIVQNGSSYCIMRTNQGEIQKLASVIFMR